MAEFYLPLGFRGAKKSLKNIKKMQSEVINYFLKKEGGLSRDPNDSASADPAPCTYKGQSGWHTNKGVTWSAYKQFCNAVGVAPSCDEFFAMPLTLWTKIYLNFYYKPFENLSESELAKTLFSWVAWGSGGGAVKPFFNNLVKENGFNSVDEMIKAKGELNFFKAFTDRRIKIYKQIADAKPQNKKFLKGWINSVSNFFEQFKKYAKN